jgi:hypothetical protein
VAGPFIPAGAALVSGYPAALLGVVARDYARRGGFDQVPANERAELLQVISALEQAAAAWRASASGNPEPPAAEVVPASLRVGTGEAAELLGICERQARSLAPGLGGRRIGGRWVLDRDAVLAERQRRIEAAA